MLWSQVRLNNITDHILSLRLISLFLGCFFRACFCKMQSVCLWFPERWERFVSCMTDRWHACFRFEFKQYPCCSFLGDLNLKNRELEIVRNNYGLVANVKCIVCPHREHYIHSPCFPHPFTLLVLTEKIGPVFQEPSFM